MKLTYYAGHWQAIAIIMIFFLMPYAHAAPVPVLVELYTSEGCSSCPSADAVLSDLIRNQPVPGVEIIAMGEHVDYWNQGGWTDPFSAAAFSARQSEYARFFHNNTVYTPQMVVDGRTEFVGSEKGRALAAIARAAHSPRAQVLVREVGGSNLQTTMLECSVRNLPAITRGDTAQVWLAITEDGLQSHVRGGENGGRLLRHAAVVRQLQILGTATGGRDFTRIITVTPAAGWQKSRLHAAVFVQEQRSRRVLGAGTGRF